MKKIIFFFLAITFALLCNAQTASNKKAIVGNRSADHFMIQIANNSWIGAADSVKGYIKTFNPSVNAYVMYDKQFKSSPKLSLGIGLGIGSSNISFNKMEAQITSSKAKLPFIRTDTGFNYKKYKIATTYLEIPLELRYMSKPTEPNKSIKAAIGVKVGTLLNAHTRAKNLQNQAGSRINGFVFKESAKTYFSSTRIAATARVGYGIYSIFGSYSLTNVFKDGVTPDIKLFQIGFSISGL